MICKEAAYDLALEEWNALINSCTLTAGQKKAANIFRAGLRAEKNMAYYLDVKLGGKSELLVFNNLKIVHRDLTAQIDHLVLSRWNAYFIETKSVSGKNGKININADGQWSRVYGKRYENFDSPLAQSRRHLTLLFQLLESRVPEFMGKILGMQTHFANTIDVQHYVAKSNGAAVQGKGKEAVDEHLWDLEQIPKQITDHHKAVRSSMLGSVIAEMHNTKTQKRDPAFSKKELEACRQLLLDADISQTPLEAVHQFIAALPPKPDAKPEPSASESKISDLKSNIKCPKCDSEMILRTAKRGDNKGKQFYGCSRFPKCRQMINVD